MSLKSTYMTLAFGMMASVADPTLGESIISSRSSSSRDTRNCGFNGKKCKSCANYHKGSIFCKDGNKNACNKYVKKKKK